ncbi:hypothetical protein B0H34DRAFT_831719 [Crassisporium funariophilum]|nr:hypothetical protein B0H34DRAFT_831719 [Crassisporium funariophilum]
MAYPTTTQEYRLTKIGSYNSLSLVQTEIPKLRANEVLVKVHAVSLQYRDLNVAKGEYGIKLPDNLVPCSDMSGEVLAIGADVKDWKKGDRVCANFATDHIYGDLDARIQATSLGAQAQGVLTQYRAFPAHSLVAIPEHLSFEEASTLPCAALTAYNGLHGPVPIKAGDYVLVLGTGGVSMFGLQFAVAAGATVIGTSSSDDKLKISSKLGAKHVINYKTTPNWDEEVKKIVFFPNALPWRSNTNGVGVDHVLEVGGAGTLPRSINAARMGGHLHIIGYVSTDIANTDVVLPVIVKAVTLRGIQIGSVAQFKDMNRLITANPSVTRPLVDTVFPFDKAIEAYAYLESQKHVGKVVIKVAM